MLLQAIIWKKLITAEVLLLAVVVHLFQCWCSWLSHVQSVRPCDMQRSADNCLLLLCVLTLSANNWQLACSRALTERALDDILRLFILRYTNVHIDWLIDWLIWCFETVWCVRAWLDKCPALLALTLYSYLRVIVDHGGPIFAQLRQREVDFCVSLMRQRVNITRIV